MQTLKTAELDEATLNQESDAIHAATLQNYLWDEGVEENVKLRLEDAAAAMQRTKSGKAWVFVEQVLQLHRTLISSRNDNSMLTWHMSIAIREARSFSAVSIDDMVYWTERLLQAQEEFGAAGKPTHVDIGYHYTRSENLDNIRTVRRTKHKLIFSLPKSVLTSFSPVLFYVRTGWSADSQRS